MGRLVDRERMCILCIEEPTRKERKGERGDGRWMDR